MVNFYFGKRTHLLAQTFLYGAVQSNAIQCIILTAQTVDNVLINIFGKTCGISYPGKFICVSTQSMSSSPFGDSWMLITIGIIVVFFMVVPLLFIKMSENMYLQLFTGVLSFLICIQWISASIMFKYYTPSASFQNIKVLDYGAANDIGVVMLSFGYTFIVPSFINLKKRDVPVQETIWSSTLLSLILYLSIGLVRKCFINQAAFFLPPPKDGNILPILHAYGVPSVLTQISTYAFTIVMLLPSIPVSLIVSRDNLVQNEIFSLRLSKFVSYYIPWIATIFIGSSIQSFQNWTSLIFVSISNYFIPIMIYIKCVQFRKAYNNDRRVLSLKQQNLIKKIHYQSIAITRYMDLKREQEAALHRAELLNPRLGKSVKGAIVINGLSDYINLEGARSPFTRIMEEAEANNQFLETPKIRRFSTSIKDPIFKKLLGVLPGNELGPEISFNASSDGSLQAGSSSHLNVNQELNIQQQNNSTAGFSLSATNSTEHDIKALHEKEESMDLFGQNEKAKSYNQAKKTSFKKDLQLDGLLAIPSSKRPSLLISIPARDANIKRPAPQTQSLEKSSITFSKSSEFSPADTNQYLQLGRSTKPRTRTTSTPVYSAVKHEAINSLSGMQSHSPLSSTAGFFIEDFTTPLENSVSKSFTKSHKSSQNNLLHSISIMFSSRSNLSPHTPDVPIFTVSEYSQNKRISKQLDVLIVDEIREEFRRDSELASILIEDLPNPDSELFDSARKSKRFSHKISRNDSRSKSNQDSGGESFQIPDILVTAAKEDGKRIEQHGGDIQSLTRRNSLPTETLFMTTSTFRAMPSWCYQFGVQARYVAWACLVLVIALTILNIVMAFVQF